MLRDIGLLHAKFLNEHASRKLAVAKEFEDGDACGMSAGLKDVGFDRFNESGMDKYSRISN